MMNISSDDNIAVRIDDRRLDEKRTHGFDIRAKSTSTTTKLIVKLNLFLCDAQNTCSFICEPSCCLIGGPDVAIHSSIQVLFDGSPYWCSKDSHVHRIGSMAPAQMGSHGQWVAASRCVADTLLSCRGTPPACREHSAYQATDSFASFIDCSQNHRPLEYAVRAFSEDWRHDAVSQIDGFAGKTAFSVRCANASDTLAVIEHTVVVEGSY